MQKNIFLFQCIKGERVRNSTDHKSTCSPSVLQYLSPTGNQRLYLRVEDICIKYRQLGGGRLLHVDFCCKAFADQELQKKSKGMKISGPIIGTVVSAVHNLPAVAPYTLTRTFGTVGSSILHILGFLKKQLTGKRFIEDAGVESSCYLLAADI